MLFSMGAVQNHRQKSRYRNATRHTPSWFSHTHPPDATSALFRCRRDVRHPSFGGGARLRRASSVSTPPAVVWIECGNFVFPSSPVSNVEFDDRRIISRPSSWLSENQGHSRWKTCARACACVICNEYFDVISRDNNRARPSLLIALVTVNRVSLNRERE